MKRPFLLILLAAGVFFPPSANAQRSKKVKQKALKAKPAPPKQLPKPAQPTMSRGDDTTIRGTTLEVYQVYKPEVKIAPKPAFMPTLPPPETAITPQEYTVPQQSLYYTYRSVPLRPLALGKDTAKLPGQNYLKGGGGNLSTIYADAGIGSLHGDNWQAAIHAQHISQQGKIADQKFLHTGLDAVATLRSDRHLWSAALDADHRRYNLYGYDHNEYNYVDGFQRRYTGIDARIGVQNTEQGIFGLDYAPSIRFNYFKGIGPVNHETTIEASLPFSKKIDSNLTVELGVGGIFTTYNAGADISGSNNIMRITPGLRYHNADYTAHLGLNPTFGRGGNSYLLPDITTAYQVSRKFEVSAGWQANLLQNTYQQLLLRNPYYSLINPLPQSRNDEVFAAATAGVGHHLSLGVRASWWEYNNLPEFVTFDGDTVGRLFVAEVAPKLNAFSLQLDARYELGNSFSFGLSGAWYGYHNRTYIRVWQEPSVRFKGDVQWAILKDLHASAYLSALGGLYGRNAHRYEQKMESIIDIGAGAEYQLIPQLSLWLNAGNLLDRPNQRWLGYDSFGINFYGGLRFRF